MDSLHEECGVAGVIGDPEAANLIYLSLYALQHRGQEACGIVTMNEDGRFFGHKDFGLVKEAFSKEQVTRLEGNIGIGHNRYATHGGKMVQNIQPFFFKTAIGSIAIAQNGNLTNADILRGELEELGSIFQSTSDTEVFTHLIARAKSSTVRERIFEVMKRVKGAYSLTIITDENKLYAIRDSFGFRPLVIGRRGNALIVASETCALDLIGATYEREVLPGEVVEISQDGSCESFFPMEKKEHAYCVFEPIYFSRPDSKVFGRHIYDLRKTIGMVLAQETQVEADVVIAVPDSGVPMAIGYGHAAKIPFELGLVRNHYVGRTFIEPTQSIRDFGVKLKLNPVESVLKGKRVVVVDDSIVRGTTSTKILRMIREAGASEIHMRIGSPPITYACFYGVDTPERTRLLAAQKDIHQMREIIGADSLGFISLAGLKQALGTLDAAAYCYACFNGDYREEIFCHEKPQPTDRNGGPGLTSHKPR